MKRYEKAGLISLCLILIFLYLWKTDRADLCDGRMKEDAFLSFADAAAREAEEAERKAKMEKIKAEGHPVTTPIIITNTDDYADIIPTDASAVAVGDEILKLL